MSEEKEIREVTFRSKIKSIFPEEVLKYIGSICDTKRIDSTQKKMKILQQLLKRYEIRFGVLGGATNRLALFIDGYAVKFAMDRQGYKDNLMEYSLSMELQPYVTKTYETNGYISINEPVKTMTLDDFLVRKIDILKVLSVLGTDYLLGDIGYIKKNFTNWGIRDDGSVVILDFAYIHRGTENLFTCDVCGDGILVYDSTFSYLKCNNQTVCNTKYTYHERKTIQGDQVDYDMIDEAKGYAIKIEKGQICKDMMIVDGEAVEPFDITKEDDRVINTDFDQTEAADLLVEKLRAKTKGEIKIIDDKLKELYTGKKSDSKPMSEEEKNEPVKPKIVNNLYMEPEPKEEEQDDSVLMTTVVNKPKPVVKEVVVEKQQPPQNNNGEIDDMEKIRILYERERQRNMERTPYGYDAYSQNQYFPMTTVVSRKKSEE